MGSGAASVVGEDAAEGSIDAAGVGALAAEAVADRTGLVAAAEGSGDGDGDAAAVPHAWTSMATTTESRASLRAIMRGSCTYPFGLDARDRPRLTVQDRGAAGTDRLG